MRTYTVTNHNGTVLGVFFNIKLAYREQLEYRAQTGNMAYVDDTESGKPANAFNEIELRASQQALKNSA